MTKQTDKTAEWENILTDFAKFVWSLSPHNFDGGNAPKFKYALEDFITYRILPTLQKRDEYWRKKIRETVEKETKFRGHCMDCNLEGEFNTLLTDAEKEDKI